MKPIRILTVLLCASLLLSCTFFSQPSSRPPAPQSWPTQGWPSGTPEEHGIDSSKLAAALLAMREQEIDIHSLLLIRNGEVVVDANFYPFDGATPHDVASVTKSVMTTLIAIATDQGALELDAPVVSFFPEYKIANLDARKQSLTVGHLASMVNGMDSLCKEQDEGTLQAMVASDDWVQFALDRKMTYDPGTHFCYDSPGMHLLSAVLQEATGKTALDFAQQNLFAPLGIQEFFWESDPQGFSDGWGDLYLRPHDMAKIGYLWLNGGEWDGKQLVARSWVEASITPQIEETYDRDLYGYGWWLSRGDLQVYSANGRGGQYIKVVPEWNLIAVTTGGGFDFTEIDPLLLPTLVDMEMPLPANPEGVAELQAAVLNVAEPPAAKPVAPLPAIAQEISGNTYLFAPNPLGVESARLDFDDSAEAVMHAKYYGREQVVVTPIGLDGLYRMSVGDHNLPQGYRGYWADTQTFALEHDNIANNDHAVYVLRFEGDSVFLGGQETAHELAVGFEGRLQTP